jgi:hypothetical protein
MIVVCGPEAAAAILPVAVLQACAWSALRAPIR